MDKYQKNSNMNIVLVSLSVQNLSGVKVPPHLLSLSAASYRDVCSLAVLVPLSLKGQRLSERQIGGRLTLRSLSHPEEPWMEQNNTRLLHTTHFPVPLDQSMSVTSPEELLGHGCVV